nr:hypothetical protein [Candidatus Saccharibacteria bacterium]
MGDVATFEVSKPDFSERIALVSHSSYTCKMLVWAVAAYLDSSQLVMYNENDLLCPDCGTRGKIGSSPSLHSSLNSGSFMNGLIPKPGAVLFIREAGGHAWQHHN